MAIELLSAFQSSAFLDKKYKLLSTPTNYIYEKLKEHIPVMEEDFYLYPHIQYLKNLIHSGDLIAWVEEKIGKLK